MKKIRKVESRREAILREMSLIRSMYRGTINEQYYKEKSGKGPGLAGPYFVLSRSVRGKTVSRRVRRGADLEQVRKDVAAQKYFVERIGGEYSVHQQKWPEWDEELARDEVITLVVQINGKVRDRLTVPAGTDEDELRRLALESPGAQRHTADKEILKVIVAGGRLVNIVVR